LFSDTAGKVAVDVPRQKKVVCEGGGGGGGIYL
jgi:hypothetical protein